MEPRRRNHGDGDVSMATVPIGTPMAASGRRDSGEEKGGEGDACARLDKCKVARVGCRGEGDVSKGLGTRRARQWHAMGAATICTRALGEVSRGQAYLACSPLYTEHCGSLCWSRGRLV